MRDEDKTKEELISELIRSGKDGGFPTGPAAFGWDAAADMRPRDAVQAALAVSDHERRRAENALLESEELYRTLMEASPDAIFMTDTRGVLTFTSRRALEMFGYTAGEDLIGQNILKWVVPEQHENVVEDIRLTLAGAVPKSSEYTLLRNDGTRFIGEVNAAAFRSPEGTPKGMLLIARDVTERRRVEKELAGQHRQMQETAGQLIQSMNMLQLVIGSIPARVFWKDRDLRYLGCNSLFARDAGLDRPEELLGMNDFDMVWREQAERYRADDRAVLESGVPRVNIVEPQTTPDGSTIWLNTSKVPLRLPGGEIFGILGVYEDITERRKTAEALSLRESYLTAIIENQPGLLWLKDTEGRYLLMNHALALSCGRRSPEEIVGGTDLDLWPREFAERYRNEDREVMARRARLVIEDRILVHGVEKPFHTCKTPVFTPDGQVLGTCGFALDVSERKLAEEEHRRLEERLQRAEKMEALGTLAGGVAHDLNNVLGIVVGYSELLLDDLHENSPERSEAMEILNGGQRAAAIVQDLLTLARRGIQGRKTLNLNSILMGCMKSPQFSELLSGFDGIKVKTDLEADLLNVSGSPVHLEKSFLNLVSNAVEAMPGRGVLTVKTRNQYLDRPVSGYDEVKEGDYVVLSVSDTGEGISAADLKRIFEPFYTKKVMGKSGTGLGLAVVWGTVKDHHGYINVESEEGRGTVFTLYFPVSREELPPEHVAVSASKYMGGGESILVVDDIRGQRELAVRMLSRLNYKATAVASGEEAVRYLEKQAVDLLVLDMIMDPGMDGLDTYAKILEIRPRQKAVIVSGFSETERVSKAQALGAGAYVKKPYVLERLGLAIRRELKRKP
ncbi:MAG: PAS domain S-box protein [Desulfobacteraceae bacterium]|nr:PAS domain S-box protein [Desulfobacteraceae bacterium]